MRLRLAGLTPVVVVALATGSPGVRAAQGQAPIVAPGSALVVEGVPPVPASLAIEVRRYTEARAASFQGWHPVRRELVISTRFGSTTQLHEVKAPGAARTQLTFFDEPVPSASYEPTAGRYLVFSRDTGGDEFSQLYRYDLADGGVTRLTDGGRSQNRGVRWSTAGTRLAYASTRRNGTDRDIYVADPVRPGSDRLVLEGIGGGWTALDWSPDDRSIVAGHFRSVRESALVLVDVESGAKTPLTAAAAQVSYSGARFSPDGRGLYLISDQGSEFGRLAFLDLSSRTVTPLVTDIAWDVDELAVSPDGRLVAFVINEAGVSKIRLYDVAARRHRAAPQAPVGVISGLEWHPRTHELGFTASSARATADVYSLDPRSGAVTRWTDSELGGLAAAELAEPSSIAWQSFDGRDITGFLYRPPPRFTGRRPVIVNLHGGPEGQARPRFLGRHNYFLNELGVALIYPNVRGSSGYGKTFLDLDNGTKRLDAVKDVGALLDWIGQQPGLDAARVMVTGGSYGGYLTLAVATTYNDRIACALDIVGISNFNTFLRNTESYRRDLRRAEYGDERVPEMREFFERTAPLNRAAQITRPLFVVQGGNDPRVPRTEAEQMVAKVRGNGSPVWYLMAGDEGHGFRKKPNADYQFYATILFVRQFLLAPAPSPSAR